MFFSPTLKSDWFYAHKVIRCFMIFFMVAMLVMPILHQPPKSEAVVPIIIVAAILTVDAILIAGSLAWHAAQPKSCQECERRVDETNEHEGLCPNKCGELIFLCVTPNAHQNRCLSCGELFYACNNREVPEEEEERYEHRKVDSDCGIHRHHDCTPENNHELNTGSCGIHSYPECAPELNHLPVDTLCDHSVFTCTEGHEDVFCDPCQIFYPACENHECPPDDSSGCCDDSSGCCDDSSGCCDDGS